MRTAPATLIPSSRRAEASFCRCQVPSHLLVGMRWPCVTGLRGWCDPPLADAFGDRVPLRRRSRAYQVRAAPCSLPSDFPRVFSPPARWRLPPACRRATEQMKASTRHRLLPRFRAVMFRGRRGWRRCRTGSPYRPFCSDRQVPPQTSGYSPNFSRWRRNGVTSQLGAHQPIASSSRALGCGGDDVVVSPSPSDHWRPSRWCPRAFHDPSAGAKQPRCLARG